MNRRECYDDIVESFSLKYDWLGVDFAKELLSTLASWNIQMYSEPELRIRRHLLLFWGHGWIKSSLLMKAAKLLGDEFCMTMSDVSHAALRGTVENGEFVSPYSLKRPFGIATEFGQIVGSGGGEITQKLLNVLEEGMVNVSLAKISSLGEAKIEQIQKDYGIKFYDNNTFSYHTNWVLIAGTYNKQFLVDNAFESRFSILTPSKKLDSTLVKFVSKSPPFTFNQDSVAYLRKELKNQKVTDCMVKLPDEAYEHFTNVRDCGQLISAVLCKRWWGVKMSKDDIIDLAKDVKLKHENVWKTSEDRVFDSIDSGHTTIPEICEFTGLSKRQVYYSLKKMRARRSMIGGKVIWEII